jgi:hypothetical protein
MSSQTTTVKLSPLGVAALTYAALGWYVFPVWGITEGKCNCGNPKCSQPRTMSNR